MGAARPGLSVDLVPDPSTMPERAEPGMDRRTFEKMRRGKLRFLQALAQGLRPLVPSQPMRPIPMPKGS